MQHDLKDDSSGVNDSAIIIQPPRVVVSQEKDAFKLRSLFFKMVEELRMRRVTDLENEKTINLLIEKNHNFEQELEEQYQRYCNLEKVLQQKEKVLEGQFDERQKQIEQDKCKLEILLGAKEKKFKALSNEMRTLQMNKHTLEKRLRELETSVFAQNDAHSVCTKQLEQMEQHCSELSAQTIVLFRQLDLLQGNVSESVALNKKLSFVNDHQNCIVEQLRTELEVKSELLVQAKSEIKVGVNVTRIATSHHDNQELKIQTDLTNKLQFKLDRLQEEHSSLLLSLKEAHQMIDKHVVSCNKSMECENALKAKMDTLLSELETYRIEVQQQCTIMEELRHSEKLKTEKLEQSISDLSLRLKSLQNDYGLLQATHDKLETSLSETMKQNMTIKQELEESVEKNLQLQKQFQLLTASNVTIETNEKSQSPILQTRLDLPQIPTLDTMGPPFISDSNEQTATTVNDNRTILSQEEALKQFEKSPKRIKIDISCINSPIILPILVHSVATETTPVVANTTSIDSSDIVHNEMDARPSLVDRVMPDVSLGAITANSTGTSQDNDGGIDLKLQLSFNNNHEQDSSNVKEAVPGCILPGSVGCTLPGSADCILPGSVGCEAKVTIASDKFSDSNAIESTQNVNCDITKKLHPAESLGHSLSASTDTVESLGDTLSASTDTVESLGDTLLASTDAVNCDMAMFSGEMSTTGNTNPMLTIDNISVTFSDDDNDDVEIKDSQLSHKIDRIQSYLKIDRLKRTRLPGPID